MNVHLAIDDTKKALSRCRAALTTLCELRSNDTHRGHIVALTKAILDLEVELAALRYQAQHPRVTA